MKESFFKFSDPYIVSLKYEENVNFDPNKFENVKLDFNNTITKNDENNQAIVTVNMEIGDMNNCPFYINISMQAFFYWDKHDDETIKDLLEKNAVSLLIGYIRPIVASITSSSRYPTFNLPFINLSDEEDGK